MVYIKEVEHVTTLQFLSKAIYVGLNMLNSIATQQDMHICITSKTKHIHGVEHVIMHSQF